MSAAPSRERAGSVGQRAAAHEGEAQAVRFRRDERHLGRPTLGGKSRGHLRRGPQNRLAPRAGTGDHQRPRGGQERSGHLLGQRPLVVGQVRDGRRGGIDGVGHRKAQPRDIVGRGPHAARRHVVKSSGTRRGDEERREVPLHHLAERRIVPPRNAERPGQRDPLLQDRLAEAEGEHRGGVGHVLAEDKDGVGGGRIGQGGGPRGAAAQDVGGNGGQAGVGLRQARREPLRADQRAEGEVGLERCPRRPDAHGPARRAQDGGHLTQGLRRRQRLAAAVGPAADRPRHAPVAIGELVPVSAAVAQEIAVDLAVVAVADAADHDRTARRGSCCTPGRSGRRRTGRSGGPTCGCNVP